MTRFLSSYYVTIFISQLFLGETSTTPLSPASPADDSSSEICPNKSRLQRIKPQSRKTFRLRRSKKNTKVEVFSGIYSITIHLKPLLNGHL